METVAINDVNQVSIVPTSTFWKVFNCRIKMTLLHESRSIGEAIMFYNDILINLSVNALRNTRNVMYKKLL